jgi:tripartite ATP-independent transporter DctM subunit
MDPLTIGILMFALLLIFILLGHHIAFIFGGLATIFGYFFWGPNIFPMFMSRIYGNMSDFILLAITLFIFMGNLLSSSGIAEGLFMALRQVIGRITGSLGISVIIVCILFAACTGVIGASVVTMGLLAGPILIRYGYRRDLATGIIGAGGTLGILIPPSIMLVIMGSQSNQSVGRLFMAAAVPGVILGFLYVAYVALRCFLNPEIGPPMPKEEIEKIPIGKRIKDLFLYAIPPLLLILTVLGSIFTGVATPTEASGVGAFVTFLMMILYRRFSWKALREAVFETAKTTTMVVFMLTTASCFTAVFLGLGCGDAIVEKILSLALGRWGTLSLMLGIVIILGCFIDWLAIVLITFPIFLPIVNELGFNELWFITLCAVALQTSFLTPPFGYALFYIFGLKLPGVTQVDVIKGSAPFIPLIILIIILVIVFPDIVLWLPGLMIR